MLREAISWFRVRRRKAVRRILFGGDTPMNFVVFQPVYEHLRRDPRINIFFSSHEKDFNKIRAIYSPFGLDKRCLIDQYTARRTEFDLFLTPIRICLGQRARSKVRTVHGVSFKGKHYKNSFRAFDYLTCPGPFLKKIYEQLDEFQADDPRLVMTGFPKVDALVNGSLDRAEILRRYRLDPCLPVVLYAPTWGRGNSLEVMGRDIMRTLAAEPVNLLVKLHDHDRAWREALEPMGGLRTRFVEETDSTPALFVADLLVSDASSVANEFTLLDRPIIFCDVPHLLSRYPNHRYQQDLGRRMGAVIHSPEELLTAVHRALADPQEHGDMRRRTARELFFEPGRATTNTLSHIYRWLDLPQYNENESSLPLGNFFPLPQGWTEVDE